jgi:hypothetical protein
MLRPAEGKFCGLLVVEVGGAHYYDWSRGENIYVKYRIGVPLAD